MIQPGEGDHFMHLPGAQAVATNDMKLTWDNLKETIRSKAIMCLYGNVGLGKSFAVQVSLRTLAPDNAHYISLYERPTPRYLRQKLFEVVMNETAIPRSPLEADRLLKAALNERFRVFVCNEAHLLSNECFAYWRHLWSDPGADLALVFVGAGKCREIIAASTLASSIYIWQEYRPMTWDQLRDVIPIFHPVWADADPDDIDFVSRTAGGTFRSWVILTHHVIALLEQQEHKRVDREVLRQALTRAMGP